MSSENTYVRYRRPSEGARISAEDLDYHRNLTDDQIHEAALSDPDAQPLTDEQLSRMKRITVARSALWRSGLTRQSFADLFGFSVDHLRDLERGVISPDPATARYLRLIQVHPDKIVELMKSAA